MKTLKVICYYLLSYTWGVIMTLIGSIVALLLLITGHKPHLFYQNIYFRVGENWGGVNFGPIFIIDKNEDLYAKQHESGHGIQNIILGPLMPFVVGIPSMMRYGLFDCTGIRNMQLVSSIATIAGELVGGFILFCGAYFKLIPLTIIGSLLIIYFVILFIWLMCKEIPKFKNSTPSYYSVWFESNASALGQKYYLKDDEEADQK